MTEPTHFCESFRTDFGTRFRCTEDDPDEQVACRFFKDRVEEDDYLGWCKFNYENDQIGDECRSPDARKVAIPEKK